MIHKINVFILSIIIALVPAYVFAATPEDIWLKTITKNVDSLGRTTSFTLDAAKRTIIDGTARDTASKLLDYKPARSAVSGVMKKRLAQAVAGGGAVLIGVAAVDALLRGIGWIMEDGVYVKIKLPKLDPDSPSQQYYYRVNLTSGKYLGDFKGSTIREVGQAVCSKFGMTLQLGVGSTNSIDCFLGPKWEIDAIPAKILNTKYDPNAPPPSPQKTPITQQELEDIMFGDYQGDPDANIAPHKNGDWTGVEETMTADPNAGEGTKDKPSNPVTKDIDQKLDANPNKKVTDHKSTDTKGDEETTKEDGTKEQTKTDSKTELPAFCNYAAFLCKHIEWMEAEPEPPTEPTAVDTSKKRDVDDYGIDMPTTFNTDRFRVNDQCPAPISTSFQLNGTQTFSLSLEPVCNILSNIKPVMIGCGYLYAAFIVTGAAKE